MRKIQELLIASAAALALMGSASACAKPVTEAAVPGVWWENATFYELYVRSFQDTDGDGTGDIKGIISRLDYLKSLGVTAIWVTPMYPSPMVDFGYDISDTENVDPRFGNLADFDALLAGAKQRGMKVIIDIVLNHTSDQHKWFQESRSSRNNPKSDYYIWVDPKGYDASGNPIAPNNWQTWFGHTAWTFDKTRKQFYYHDYAPEQPDLNWRNPAVKKAMFNTLRFWLDRGVDGVRLDSIFTIYEDPSLRDGPLILDKAGKPTIDAFGETAVGQDLQGYQPGLHPLMRDLRKLFDSYPGSRVMVGETYGMDIKGLDEWYGGARKDEIHLPMDTILGVMDKDNNYIHLDVNHWRSHLKSLETEIHGAEPLFVIDNHDSPRMDRFCTSEYGGAAYASCADIQKMLATVIFGSRASVLMYYGDEIGMTTNVPERIEDVLDPEGKAGWPKDKGRDGSRTPMQWTAQHNAGFSEAAKTWLPVGRSYTSVNVEAQEQDPNSLLHWYRTLLHLRSDNKIFQNGSQQVIDTTNPNLLIFYRKSGIGTALVITNFSGDPQAIPEGLVGEHATMLAKSFVGEFQWGKSVLPPYGAVIVDVSK